MIYLKYNVYNITSIFGMAASIFMSPSICETGAGAQALSFVAGAFVPGSVGAGFITIKAYGKKPKVDLPVILLIHGKERT